MIFSRLYTLLLGFLAFSTIAAQEVGPLLITYESVEDVRNNPLEYVLTAYQIYDTTGGTPPSTVEIDYYSFCYPGTTYVLPRITGGNNNLLPLNGSDYCSPHSGIANDYGLGIFRDTIVLGGTCHFTFFSATADSGHNSTTNMAYTTNDAFFWAFLANTMGPNSNPGFDPDFLIQTVCTGKPVRLYGFSEKEGDSLYFHNTAPLEQLPNGGLISMGYASGYHSNPLGSPVYEIDSISGALTTNLPHAGTFLISIGYKEYRYDTVGMEHIIVSQGYFSMLLIASANCNTVPFGLTHLSAPGSDSLNCGDSTLQLATTRKIAPGSLTATGSEFRVVSARSGALPVTSATLIGDSIIELGLDHALTPGDTVRVMARAGTDNNVIYSKCGKEITSFADTLWFFTETPPLVSASFSHSAHYLSVGFSQASTSADSSRYSWDFGDGSSSVHAVNPSHRYAAPGIYSVRLTTHNECGMADTATQTIRVCDTISAGFSFVQNGDTLSVDGSLSAGAESYYWQFGDGSSDTGRTARHVYSQQGSFAVTLLATNACGDSSTVADSVVMCAPSQADWTYTVVNTGGNGMLVDFDGTASVNAHSFVWDFGDGNQNTTSLTPSHVYVTPSLNYFVSLTTYNECSQQNVRAFRLNEIGLDELSVVSSFDIFPNPAGEDLNVQWDPAEYKPFAISVFAVSGQKVMTVVPAEDALLSGRLSLSVSELPAGAYFLWVRGEGFAERRIFSVKH